MPLYEFKCQACEETFEVRQEWKAPYPACPECQSADVKKVLHAAALVFKGSGWHVNDYGKSGPSKGSKLGETASAESSASASSTTPSPSSSSDTTTSGSSSVDKAAT